MSSSSNIRGSHIYDLVIITEIGAEIPEPILIPCHYSKESTNWGYNRTKSVRRRDIAPCLRGEMTQNSPTESGCMWRSYRMG